MKLWSRHNQQYPHYPRTTARARSTSSFGGSLVSHGEKRKRRKEGARGTHVENPFWCQFLFSFFPPLFPGNPSRVSPRDLPSVPSMLFFLLFFLLSFLVSFLISFFYPSSVLLLFDFSSFLFFFFFFSFLFLFLLILRILFSPMGPWKPPPCHQIWKKLFKSSECVVHKESEDLLTEMKEEKNRWQSLKIFFRPLVEISPSRMFLYNVTLANSNGIKLAILGSFSGAAKTQVFIFIFQFFFFSPPKGFHIQEKKK